MNTEESTQLTFNAGLDYLKQVMNQLNLCRQLSMTNDIINFYRTLMSFEIMIIPYIKKEKLEALEKQKNVCEQYYLNAFEHKEVLRSYKFRNELLKRFQMLNEAAIDAGLFLGEDSSGADAAKY